MTQVAIVYPVFVQVLLTLTVLVLLAPARGRSMRERRQRLRDSDVTLGRDEWSEEAAKRGNNYRNQFELPVLFYAVAAFALITKSADTAMIVLAWIFVLLRIVHAAIHIGPNVIKWRAPTFALGAIIVLIMWVRVVLHVATAGPA